MGIGTLTTNRENEKRDFVRVSDSFLLAVWYDKEKISGIADAMIKQGGRIIMSEFKPLEGVKVIEWTTFVAAPVCGRLLADWGADVIKVETPEGDYWRTYGPKMEVPATDEENPLFDIPNANKRSITLNLRSQEGREIMEKLVAQSDIMITNTRERILKKLELDYDSVSRRYPGIIYAQISGYGEKGPEANRPGYDAVTYWAHSGFFADMKLDEPGSLPISRPQSATSARAACCSARSWPPSMRNTAPEGGTRSPCPCTARPSGSWALCIPSRRRNTATNTRAAASNASRSPPPISARTASGSWWQPCSMTGTFRACATRSIWTISPKTPAMQAMTT